MATEHYRVSSLGVALTDSIDEMIAEGLIDPQLAQQIMVHFYKTFTTALKEKAKKKATIKGDIEQYNMCFDVLTVVLKNPQLKIDKETIHTERIKIVACKDPTSPIEE